MDDTRLRKTGRKILSAFYQRDPLSPKFRFNLMWGLRFFHVSLLLPLYRTWEQAAPRSVPIRFVEVPALKRPRRKAAPEDWSAYRRAVKHHNLSQQGVRVIRELRGSLDQAGGGARVLLAVGDGSFCNRTLFRIELDRTQVLARARKDIRLCYRAAAPSRSFYSAEKFTPELVRQNEDVAWETAAIFHGGQCRQVRFKQVPDVYWQTGGRKRPLRLLVVAPIPYAGGNGRKKYYRDAAYLLTTDNSASAEALLQAYFDRWQIEVNHREIKDTLGIGQAQLRHSRSVPRQPAMLVAAYSALLLAGIQVFGDTRPEGAFPALPKWRRNAKRPSCLDLVTLLRKEISSVGNSSSGTAYVDWKNLVLAAAA